MQCTKHPDRETFLSCTACDRPFCFQCLVQGPVGAKCKDCTRGIAPDATAAVRAKAAVKANDHDRTLAAKVVVALILACNLYFYVRDGSASSTFGLEGSNSFALDAGAIANGDWWRVVTGAIAGPGFVVTGVAAAATWWLGARIAPRLSHLQFAAMTLLALACGALALMVARPRYFGFGILSVPGAFGGAFAMLRKRGDVGRLVLPQWGPVNLGMILVSWLLLGALRSDPGMFIALGAGAACGAAFIAVMSGLGAKFGRDRSALVALGAAVLVFAAAGTSATSSGTSPGRSNGADRDVVRRALERSGPAPAGWMVVRWWEERFDTGDFQTAYLRCAPAPEVQDLDDTAFLGDGSAACAWLVGATVAQRTMAVKVPAACSTEDQLQWRVMVSGPGPSGPVSIDALGADGWVDPSLSTFTRAFGTYGSG